MYDIKMRLTRQHLIILHPKNYLDIIIHNRMRQLTNIIVYVAGENFCIYLSKKLSVNTEFIEHICLFIIIF